MPRGTTVAAIIIVDFEGVFDVVAGGGVAWELVAVEDVAEVALETSDTTGAIVGTREEDDDEVWDEDGDDVSEGRPLETAEEAASPVTLTTDIAPNPAERVKFCEHHSLTESVSQTQAKMPCSS